MLKLSPGIILPNLLLNPVCGFSSPADRWQRDRSTLDDHVVEEAYDCGLRSAFPPHDCGLASNHVSRSSDLNVREIGESLSMLRLDLFSGSREVKVSQTSSGVLGSAPRALGNTANVAF